MASSYGNKLSREDYKKQKELEELRKSGAVEPEKDEDGKDINPHIPQYIAQAPWYLNNSNPSLKHQRVTKKIDYTKDWYRRGAKLGTAAETFRKGACENCGAMTHAKKDCVERPRKLGAKHTGTDIQPDEVVDGGFVLSYDGRRDRWNGYDSTNYLRVMKEYEVLEEARKEAKKEKAEEMLKKGELNEKDIATLNDDDDDEDVKDENSKLVGQKFDVKNRTSVRNLRIREDTAKYLRNLDPNSAYYDPKTRSMRMNPNPELDPEQTDYAGDNFIRYSGEVKNFAHLQLYELGAHDNGQDVHLQAAPTQAAFAHEQFRQKKATLQMSKQDILLSKYGGEEHVHKVLPPELKYGQSEAYVEYSVDGSLVKGQEAAVPKSKYEEDVFIGNHTTVWGSWWNSGVWGYSCCHSTIRNSFCTGEDGKAASHLATREMADMVQKLKSAPQETPAESEEKRKAEALKRALKEEDERAKLSAEELDDRKRPYNSLKKEATVTEEDMEAYRLRRRRMEDPMANYKDVV